MQTGLLVLLLRTDALHDARGRAGFPSLCGAESEGFRRIANENGTAGARATNQVDCRP